MKVESPVESSPDEDARLLSVAEVASRLGVPIQTIYQWNSRRTGPHFIRVGRHVRYQPSDVRAWIAAHRTGGGANQ